jgi:hypothetical protein
MITTEKTSTYSLSELPTLKQISLKGDHKKKYSEIYKKIKGIEKSIVSLNREKAKESYKIRADKVLFRAVSGAAPYIEEDSVIETYVIGSPVIISINDDLDVVGVVTRVIHTNKTCLYDVICLEKTDRHEMFDGDPNPPEFFGIGITISHVRSHRLNCAVVPAEYKKSYDEVIGRIKNGMFD